MTVTVSMPHLGEAVTEGTILSWAKQPGETVAEDEVLLEIATDTDKVDTEVPSPIAGVVQVILVSAGQTVSVGTPLAVIAESAETATPGLAATAATPAAAPPAQPPETSPAAETPAPPPPEPEPAGASASPEDGSGVTGSGAQEAGQTAGQDTPGPDAETETGAPSEQTWVTLSEAELRTGVAVSTLNKWRKRHKIASRTALGPTGTQVWVPLQAVSDLAAEKEAKRARRGEAAEGASPRSAEQDSPQWAIELLALADARAGQLLDRLAQAERERADAERDAAIERHKRERAEAEAARLRDELAGLTRPEPAEGVRPEPGGSRQEQTPYATFRARLERWTDRRRGRA